MSGKGVDADAAGCSGSWATSGRERHIGAVSCSGSETGDGGPRGCDFEPAGDHSSYRGRRRWLPAFILSFPAMSTGTWPS